MTGAHRCLLIGCGSIGRRHGRNLAASGTTELLVFDSDRTRCLQVADELCATACSSLDSAYKMRPSAVFVCAPTHLHLQLARDAVRNGCDVFIEKPLSHTMEGVSQFCQEVESSGRVVMVGHNLRFDPLLVTIRDWLSAGRVGRVLHARLHFGSLLSVRHPWEDYRQGYGANRSMGGGVVLDAIHEIDYALWLFGTPQAVLGATTKVSALEIDVEDLAEIVLIHPTCLISIHLDYVQQPHQRWCRITGTGGELVADMVERTLSLRSTTGEVVETYQPPQTADDVYVDEIRHFLSCVAQRSPATVTPRIAAQALAVAIAAKESSARGVTIGVDGELLERER